MNIAQNPLNTAEIQQQPRKAFLSYYIYSEFLKLARMPAFMIPTLLSPVLFFALFGLPNVKDSIQSVNAASYIMVSLGSYATMFTGFVTFGAGVASERGLGWNKLMRATPLHPLAYFFAKLVVAIFMGLLSLGTLFAFALLVGKLSIPATTLLQIAGLLVVDMIPFIIIGFALGYIAGPNSAAPIASMLFLVLGFGSGLLIPLQFAPDFIQKIAPYFPSYHAAQLGWSVLGAGDGKPFWFHLLWLAGYTTVFLVLAVIAYQRDESKNFG